MVKCKRLIFSAVDGNIFMQIEASVFWLQNWRLLGVVEVYPYLQPNRKLMQMRMIGGITFNKIS